MRARPPSDGTPREIHRAARLLWIRSRREVSEPLTGEYASAFRGGGIEFEESRPYTPGDDVRALDWNALARTGEPWVKRFREERSRTVLIALDVSGSMAFGSTGRSKALLGAHVAALLVAAAGRMGDRVGLLTYTDRIQTSLPPRRGEGHAWRLIRAAARAGVAAAGATALAPVVDWVRRHARGRAVVVCVSDFRDDSAFSGDGSAPTRRELAALGRRHDMVAVVCEDPLERELRDAGVVRIADAEAPGGWTILRTADPQVRAAYARAASLRRARLDRELRRAHLDPLRLSTADDPLRTLSRFFHRRAVHGRRVA